MLVPAWKHIALATYYGGGESGRIIQEKRVSRASLSWAYNGINCCMPAIQNRGGLFATPKERARPHRRHLLPYRHALVYSPLGG